MHSTIPGASPDGRNLIGSRRQPSTAANSEPGCPPQHDSGDASNIPGVQTLGCLTFGRSGLMALCLVLGLSGCSTMEVTQDRKQTIDSYPHRQERAGVVVAVQPVTDRAELKQWFRSDIASKGVLPVLVIAENRSSGQSFILGKEKVFLADDGEDDPQTRQRGPVKSATAGEVTMTAGVMLLSLPGTIAGLKMASDATVIEHNLVDKELFSRTIDPGKEAHGFAYFQFPKGTPITPEHRIIVELLNPKTGEPVRFDFDLR